MSASSGGSFAEGITPLTFIGRLLVVSGPMPPCWERCRGRGRAEGPGRRDGWSVVRGPYAVSDSGPSALWLGPNAPHTDRFPCRLLLERNGELSMPMTMTPPPV